MNHPVRAVGTFLVGVLFLATVVSGQAWSGVGRLSGTVQDTDGNRVEGASVKLTLEGAGPDDVMTNGRGRWARAGLRSGPWIVRVSKAGYVPTEHSVLLNEHASSSDRVSLKTKLEPASAPADGSVALVDDEEAEVARELLARGNALIAEGDQEGAVAAFQEALPGLPESAKAAVLISIASNQASLGRDDEAVATLEQALALAPANTDALLLLSRRLSALGRAEEAHAYLERLPENMRADPEILLREGVELYNRNEFEAALAKFNTVVEGFPDVAEAYYFRGLANLAAGNNDTAAADFRRLLELEPEGERAAEAKQFAEYLESL